MTKNIVPKALSKNELMLLIPETIKIDELIKDAISYSIEIDPKKLLSLLSLITTELTSYNYEKERHVTHKKINIHSNDLKKCCGNNYKVYFNFLYESDILSTRSPFNKNLRGQSFGYGFTKSHAFRRLKLIVIENVKPINHDKKFTSYVKKYEEILYKPFDRTKFSIDSTLAEENLFNKYIGNITFPLNSDDKFNWRKYSAYHGALKQLLMFLNGEHKFIRKTKPSETKPSGRFYSPLTFLNKATRSLLYYESKRLHQLDVKNMFPYLLSQYLPTIAKLDYKRFERLQNCSAFKAKYKLTYTSYTAKDYLPNQWLEQYLMKQYGTLLIHKPMYGFTKGYLGQQVSNKYFFLDKPKGLFQNSNSHFQQYNKKFYSPFLNNSQKENKAKSYNKLTHENWNSQDSKQLQRDIYLNRYNKTKGLSINSPLATPYTGTFKSSAISEQLNPTQMEYSNYISTKIFETLMNKEILKFKTLCTEGIIYDYFINSFKDKFHILEWALEYQKLSNTDYNYLYEQDRDLAKRLFISMLYAKNNHYIKEQEVFKSEFPILHDLIWEKKRGNHKIITHELFDLEAKIIVDTVARDLLKKHITTFTIHDCIVIQEGNIEVSELKMKNIFISKFGSCPQIKLE